MNLQGTDITNKRKSADLILPLVILLEEIWGSKMEAALPLSTIPQAKSASSHFTSDLSVVQLCNPCTSIHRAAIANCSQLTLL